MQAVRVHEYGEPEALTFEEVAAPEVGPGEALIKIEASGVNFIDIYHRNGQYPGQLPITPGVEGAGVVEAIGSGVTDIKVGDRVVYVLQQGSYAQYAKVPVQKLVIIPDNLDTKKAAAVMLQGLTAHYLTDSTYPLRPGDSALVHAAAGGVGLLLVQISKLKGAFVIGTVSTEEKAELARKAGADEVILYTEADFEAETKRITGGKGVNVVYESVGKTTFDQSLNCLKPRGYMALYGQSSGPVPPLNPQILNAKGSLFLTRPSLGHYIASREEMMSRTNDLFTWIAEGKLDVRVDRDFSLADASEAHRYMEGRKTKGKILVVP